jgi:hypothetical protein
MLTFPVSCTPNFIDFELPDYIKNSQEFKSTDKLIQIYQTQQIGLTFNCRYQRLSLAKLNTVRNFYYAVNVQSFLLPTDFLVNFDPTVKPILTAFPYWIFKDSIKINPQIINRNNKLFDFQFTLQNVFS